MLRTITIVSTNTGTILAQGLEGNDVVRLEGNWYFDPSVVQTGLLLETQRLYVCPHKGVCNWLDLSHDGTTIKDVAWVYHDVKPNYTHIKGKIGFYGGTHAATRETWEVA